VKLLLDTHIWLWSAGEPERLVPRIASALLDPRNERWISPISVWEILILAQKRRLTFSEDIAAWIARSLKEFGLNEAPLTTDVVIATRTLSLPHRDPADLFLAATAKVFDLTLVTSDSRLLNVAGVTTIANR